jgi:hypothetical protein
VANGREDHMRKLLLCVLVAIDGMARMALADSVEASS